MKTTESLPPAQKSKKLLKLGTFGLGAFGFSILLHLGLLFLVGSAVIIQGVIPKQVFTDASVPAETITDQTMPAEDPPASEEPLPSQDEPTAQTPASNSTSSVLPDVLTTEAISTQQSFVPATTLPSAIPTMPGTTNGNPEGKTGNGTGKGIRNMGSLFGSSGESSDGLIGHFYDLKQTTDHKPYPQAYSPAFFEKVVSEFLKKGWDPTVLDGFYKAKKAMTAYQICIPQMDANEAPKAFGVEKDVQPKGLLVHYVGSFIAPKTGSFRFVGNGDDILFVRINHKNVLNTSTPGIVEAPLSEKLNGKVWLSAGPWINMQQGETYFMEVLIGEKPGGLFHAFLFIQDRQVKPEIDPVTNLPILPVFQTAPTKVPKYPLFPAAIRNPKAAEEPFVATEKNP